MPFNTLKELAQIPKIKRRNGRKQPDNVKSVRQQATNYSHRTGLRSCRSCNAGRCRRSQSYCRRGWQRSDGCFGDCAKTAAPERTRSGRSTAAYPTSQTRVIDFDCRWNEICCIKRQPHRTRSMNAIARPLPAGKHPRSHAKEHAYEPLHQQAPAFAG